MRRNFLLWDILEERTKSKAIAMKQHLPLRNGLRTAVKKLPKKAKDKIRTNLKTGVTLSSEKD